MKKQLALVLALASFLMSSCDDENLTNPGASTRPAAVIRYIYPNVGSPGSTLAIHGENFGATVGDNLVAFDSTHAEVTYAGHGTIHVLVPMNLVEGEYTIDLITEGSVCRAPYLFTVSNNPR
jgi:hypothetical protein